MAQNFPGILKKKSSPSMSHRYRYGHHLDEPKVHPRNSLPRYYDDSSRPEAGDKSKKHSTASFVVDSLLDPPFLSGDSGKSVESGKFYKSFGKAIDPHNFAAVTIAANQPFKDGLEPAFLLSCIPNLSYTSPSTNSKTGTTRQVIDEPISYSSNLPSTIKPSTLIDPGGGDDGMLEKLSPGNRLYRGGSSSSDLSNFDTGDEDDDEEDDVNGFVMDNKENDQQRQYYVSSNFPSARLASSGWLHGKRANGNVKYHGLREEKKGTEDQKISRKSFSFGKKLFGKARSPKLRDSSDVGFDDGSVKGKTYRWREIFKKHRSEILGQKDLTAVNANNVRPDTVSPGNTEAEVGEDRTRFPFPSSLHDSVQNPPPDHLNSNTGYQAVIRKRFHDAAIPKEIHTTITTISPILKSNGKYVPFDVSKSEVQTPDYTKKEEDETVHDQVPIKRVHIGSSPLIIPYSPIPSFETSSPNSPGYSPHHRRFDEKAHTREAFRKNFFDKLSYLYALILISIGLCLPVSEAIAQDFPLIYHEVYCIYLFVVSICFFFYTYFFLIRYYTKTDMLRKASVVLMQRRSIDNDAAKLLIKKQRVTEFESSTGSFYLRMGALVFSAGSMIYSGLQFSEFFDSTLTSTCTDILGGVVPILNLLFTFIQTYFIFSHSKICIHKYKTLARFGLMHLVATNLCVWIITLVRQTIEEIEWFHHEIQEKGVSNLVINVSSIINEVHAASNATNHKVDNNLLCTKSKRDIILSKIVEDAGPFLYPCTIEYSLICAAISYVLWKNIGEVPRFRKSRRSRHSYTVNCEGASRGLFVGLCVMVFSIITLILFFVLIERKEYFVFAVYLNQVTEVMVYLVALISIAMAYYKMRALKFIELRDREKLDSLLLSIAVAGEYFFSIFSIVSTIGHISHRTILLLTSSVINVIESTAQTVFIVDALNRFSITEKNEKDKPGRQFVTFLIICNFALWGFNTFANERTRTNPIQIEFYGYVTWNIITHICTPLSIFYRYHSTACLAEVWKQAYKTRIDESI